MAGSRCPNCSRGVPAEAVFCPACGQPLTADARPEGTRWVWFLDRSWDFFASVRVAIWLILLLALASISGSLIEQEGLYNDWRPPEQYYPFRYGAFWGNFYLKSGLTDAYGSWWYLTLLSLLSLSLIICSIQRLVPLYRALRQPAVSKSADFIRRQTWTAEIEPRSAADDEEAALEAAGAWLTRQRFKVYREGSSLHGDRGRLSRYGPYIIHIGLLLVAAAGFTRALPGWYSRESIWVADGQVVRVPGTHFSLRSDGFKDEYYPTGMPKLFVTTATIIDDGKEVKQQEIKVNHPLHYAGVDLFQASFRREMGWADLRVVDGAGQTVGKFRVDLKNPADRYQVGDLTVAVRSYFADFGLEGEMPVNLSREVKNPVFYFEFLNAKGVVAGSHTLPLLMPDFMEGKRGPYFVALASDNMNADLTWRVYSGLMIYRDRSIPFMAAGVTVVLLGMLVTFFVYHRQVWVKWEAGRLVIGARTNKDKHGLKREMNRLLTALGGVGSDVRT